MADKSERAVKASSESSDTNDKSETKPKEEQPGSGLSRKERAQAREAVRHRPAVVYETIRIQGENELRRPTSALWWSGVAAGISIGFSFLTEAVLAAHLPASDWSPIISKLGYSVGFLIVILSHQQLFTENVLTAVLPVMARKEKEWLLRMLRLWGIVLAANLIGCAIFAAAITSLPLVSAKAGAAMHEMVSNLMANTPAEMFAKGIGSGWLIAAVVWILASSERTAFVMITLLTYLIAFFGFTHIVAGSVEAIYGVLNGIIDLPAAVSRFFLPVLAGNVFGGTVLFSVLSHAQVREEIYADRGDR